MELLLQGQGLVPQPTPRATAPTSALNSGITTTSVLHGWVIASKPGAWEAAQRRGGGKGGSVPWL